jgi:outer membrane protein TolC
MKFSKMKSINFLFIGFFLFHINIVSGQQMSLDDALIYAQKNNSSLREANINIADAEGQIIENKAIGLPQVRLGVDYNYYLQIPKQVVPEKNFDPVNGREGEFLELTFALRQNFNVGLNAEWLALDGTYIYGLKAARLFRDFRQKELAAVEKNVRDAVIEAYLPALIITENMKNLDKNITTTEELLKETKEIYKEGFIESLDVTRLELSLATLTTQKNNLERQKEMVINSLKFTLGYPMSESLEIVDDLEAIFTAEVPEELTQEIDVTIRPEYQTAQMGIELNELNIKRYKAGYLPSLRLFGSYQQAWQGDKFNEGFWFPNSLIGARLVMPIFDGFLKKGQIQRAQLDLEKANLQMNDLERGIYLEVENAKTAYLNAMERLKDEDYTLDLAQDIYDAAVIKYKEGVGSSVELIQAEQLLYDVQRNRIQAMYDVLVARKGLEKAFNK